MCFQVDTSAHPIVTNCLASCCETVGYAIFIVCRQRVCGLAELFCQRQEPCPR